MNSARRKNPAGKFSQISFFAVVLGLTSVVAQGTAVEAESLLKPQAQATPTTSEARSRRVSETTGQAAQKTDSPAGSSTNPQTTEQSPAASLQAQTSTDLKPRRSRNRRRPPIENPISVPEASATPALQKSVWSPPTYQTVTATPTPASRSSRIGSLLRAIGRTVQRSWVWSLSVLVLSGLGFIGIRWRSRREAADKAQQGHWQDEKIGPINDVLEETPEPIQSLPIIAEAFEDVVSEPEVEADESAPPVAGGSSPTVREGSGSDTRGLLYSRATAVQVVEPLGDAKESKLQAEEELRREQDALLKSQEELQRLRLKVADARRKADEERRALAEATTQIRADEEARHELEEELQRLKLEAKNRFQEERSRYEETRRHVIEEQQRVQTELGRLFAEEYERLKALELQKQQADEELKQRFEQERRIKGEIEELFKAGTEQRARIEVETRRRAEAELRLSEEQARLHEAADARVQAEEAANTVQAMGVHGPEGATVEKRNSEDSTISPELTARLNSGSSHERANALRELAVAGNEDAFRLISQAFDDSSADVRSAAARALYDFQVDRAASYARALKEGSPERRRSIAESVASSGLARDAIANLTAESREQTYDAFSILFLMARAGEFQPLLSAVEDYPDLDVRLAVVKLLGLTGQAEIIPAFQSFSEQLSFPAELRSAITDVISQISSKSEQTSSSVA